ncbi:MAG TPA: arginine--tRNA ligase [Candidatus Paceibacterota bacterium]|nr:arginine--tRNA ligase [Candidatus Paceibacterota bacterium]
MDPVSSIRERLAQALAGAGSSVVPEDIVLEHTADLSHGDYASNVALVYAKQLGKNPRELAEQLAAAVRDAEGVASVEVAGPGFINFTLSPEYLYEMLEIGRKHGEKWGSGVGLKGKKVIVEYTDPNPFKEFHIGHLVTNAIGESISRLFAFSGATVKRANYQGDVGRHVARAIWGLLQSGESAKDVKALGRAYAAGAAADVDGSPVKEEITAINKKVYERSDKAITKLYDEGRKTSLAHFEELYDILGTKFDYYFFESETGPFGKQVVEKHVADGVFKESEGAIVYDGEKKGLHTRVFLNSEGLPTYEAKELGLSKMKYDTFKYDTSVIVTGNEINEYFKVLLAAMSEVFPELAAKTRHVSHGMMRLQEGKMSSRTGNVVTGESLIEDLADVAKARAAESRARDKEKLAQDIAVAAIKFQILKGAMGKDIVFNREQALSIEGDSGPYLQYTHARCHAIMEKAKEAKVKGKFDAGAPPSDLTRLVYRFYETVVRAQEQLEPHIVANYLIMIASAFNSWYAKEQILDGTPAAAHKVAVADITRLTLKNGLWLLGIPAPEKV